MPSLAELQSRRRDRWSDHLTEWAAWARDERHLLRWDTAVEAVQRAHRRCGELVACISGGKDSSALAAVVREAEVPARAVHAHSPLNIPGMLEVAEETAERCGWEIDVAEPDVEDVWTWLAELPGRITQSHVHDAMLEVVASGDMLHGYLNAAHALGAYSGMRAEESRGRRMNRVARGHLYKLRGGPSRGRWMCLPIVDWEARDVYATVVSRGMPLHPHYRSMVDRYGCDPHSPGEGMRVDLILPEDRVIHEPLLWRRSMTELYPEAFARLLRARPELR